MKTDKITVFDLFEKQRRYLVPIFQRGYVWNKERQWAPLWEDISEQATLVSEHDSSSKSTIRKHFLGTIVLSHIPTVIRQTPASEIIDGQQRLLTLQVFLIAFRDAIADLGDDYLNTQLAHLTANVGPFSDDNEQFKVWPTNAYQQDVRNVMNAGSAQKLAAMYPQKMYRRKLVPPLPALVEAYFYFYGEISVFLNEADEEVDGAVSGDLRSADGRIPGQTDEDGYTFVDSYGDYDLLISPVRNGMRTYEIWSEAACVGNVGDYGNISEENAMKQFHTWVNSRGQRPSPLSQERLKERANVLFEALMRYVQLVEIQLDSEDDPQVIFETLNYGGVPLEPSDLIRNFIFLYANRQDKDVNALYNQWWKDYDEASGTTGKFWKEKERQGRFFRSRLDLFFFHYLTYRVGREIKMGHIYQEFKDWWGDSAERLVETELEAAQRSSVVFRSLLDSDDSQPLGVLAQRLRILDTTTVYPFILWLCENRHKTTPEAFDGILADIESYVVRRAVCRLTPKNYNRIFLTLLTKLKDGTPNRTSVRRELLSLEGASAVWPGDETLKRHLIHEPLYDSIGPRRVRLVLTALELTSRTPRQETLPLPINNSLTIEHVMPQGFKSEEWPYPEQETDEEREQESKRWTVLHSLGNLTMLTQPLNSEVSNGPFRSKRPEITKQSLLILNSYFQRFSDSDAWDEDRILERGTQLAGLALKVWEYPST